MLADDLLRAVGRAGVDDRPAVDQRPDRVEAASDHRRLVLDDHRQTNGLPGRAHAASRRYGSSVDTTRVGVTGVTVRPYRGNGSASRLRCTQTRPAAATGSRRLRHEPLRPDRLPQHDRQERGAGHRSLPCLGAAPDRLVGDRRHRIHRRHPGDRARGPARTCRASSSSAPGGTSAATARRRCSWPAGAPTTSSSSTRTRSSSWTHDFASPAADRRRVLVTIALDGWTYPRRQLVRDALPWRYEGVLHESIVCEQARSEAELKGIRTIPYQDGSRSRDPNTYRRDALCLEEALIDDPDNSRYVFYLAQSYRDAGDRNRRCATTSGAPRCRAGARRPGTRCTRSRSSRKPSSTRGPRCSRRTWRRSSSCPTEPSRSSGSGCVISTRASTRWRTPSSHEPCRSRRRVRPALRRARPLRLSARDRVRAGGLLCRRPRCGGRHEQ